MHETRGASTSQQLGISVATVANRLRQLQEDNYLAFTVVVDWEAAGFHSKCLAFVSVDGAQVRPVADQIAQLPEAQFVLLTIGAADIHVTLIASDSTELLRVLDQVHAVKGVAAVEIDMDLDYHSYRCGQMSLSSRPWHPSDLPEPIIELSPLDHALIVELCRLGSFARPEHAVFRCWKPTRCAHVSSFRTGLLERCKRADRALTRVVATCYLPAPALSAMS